MDEAGRGPLFGPLYIGLVISNISSQQLKKHSLFKDSKTLSPKKREEAYSEIIELSKKNKITFMLGSVDAGFIDTYGITRSINVAVYKGLYQYFSSFLHKGGDSFFTVNILSNLIHEYEKKFNDHVEIIFDGKIDFGIGRELGIQTSCVIHGDAKYVEISMASILAKVTRDKIIDQFDTIYPNYSLSKHKGYGTKIHYEAIRQYGVVSEHRKLFLKPLFPNHTLKSFNLAKKIYI